MPIWKNGKGDETEQQAIEGVIGVIQDVTELKTREEELATQNLEKQQLLANEAAAKEASRLKSEFLANVRLARLALLASNLTDGQADVSRDPDPDYRSHRHVRASP